MTLAVHKLSVARRLTDVSAELETGTITAICGPNGAGKSSLLEALAGLLPPDGGSVTLDGQALPNLAPRARARRIGYLPQAHEIAWDVPVHSLVELGRLPHGDRGRDAAEAALSALDITHLALRRAQSLSGGETARVLLARVLAGEPQWILADEPLAALDIGHQLALLRHFRRVAEQGTGVVLVLHDLAHALNHADRVIVLDEGRLVTDGGCEDALDHRLIERVWKVPARWIGEPGHRALVVG